MTDNSFADWNDKRGAATMKRSFERFTSFLMAFLMALNILMPTSAFAALSTDYQLGSSGGFYKVAIEFDGAAPNLAGYRAFIRVKDQYNSTKYYLSDNLANPTPEDQFGHSIVDGDVVLRVNPNGFTDYSGNAQGNVNLQNVTIEAIGLVKLDGGNAPKNIQTYASVIIPAGEISTGKYYKVANNTSGSGINSNHKLTLSSTSFDPGEETKYILDDLFEFGVVADTYNQTHHTETNFAVHTFTQDNTGGTQCLTIEGSGSVPVPIYVETITNNLVVGEQNKVFVDIYAPSGQKNKIINQDKTHTISFIPDENIGNAVDALISAGKGVSSSLSSSSRTTYTYVPQGRVKNPNNKTDEMLDDWRIIDLRNFPNNATIYVDCTNIKNVLADEGWYIYKKEGQTVVFNIPGSESVNIAKFNMTVFKPNGKEVLVSEFASDTYGRDSRHDENVRVYNNILKHVVFNAYQTTGTLNITGAASGVFLAPLGNIDLSGGSGAGWAITGGDFTSGAEWHYYVYDRNYKVASNITGKKVLQNPDGETISIGNKKFEFNQIMISPRTNTL